MLDLMWSQTKSRLSSIRSTVIQIMKKMGVRSISLENNYRTSRKSIFLRLKPLIKSPSCSTSDGNEMHLRMISLEVLNPVRSDHNCFDFYSYKHRWTESIISGGTQHNRSTTSSDKGSYPKRPLVVRTPPIPMWATSSRLRFHGNLPWTKQRIENPKAFTSRIYMGLIS